LTPGNLPRACSPLSFSWQHKKTWISNRYHPVSTMTGSKITHLHRFFLGVFCDSDLPAPLALRKMFFQEFPVVLAEASHLPLVLKLWTFYWYGLWWYLNFRS
jgi:hypothetical protein